MDLVISITDLLKLIFSELSTRELMAARGVSRRWLCVISMMLEAKEYELPIDALIDGNLLWIRKDRLLEYAYINLSDEFLLYSYITSRTRWLKEYIMREPHKFNIYGFAENIRSKKVRINLGYYSEKSSIYSLFSSYKPHINVRSEEFERLVANANNLSCGGLGIFRDDHCLQIALNVVVRVEVYTSKYSSDKFFTSMKLNTFLTRFGKLLIDYAA